MERIDHENFRRDLENFCNIQLIKNYKSEIRTKICKELDKIYKKDDKFSRILEMIEIDLFKLFLSECKIESNLNKLVDIYRSIHRLNEYIENFNDILNTNLKK